MASRSIHLAVTNRIAEKIKVKDINRLRLGSVLPDAYAVNIIGIQPFREMWNDCTGITAL